MNVPTETFKELKNKENSQTKKLKTLTPHRINKSYITGHDSLYDVMYFQSSFQIKKIPGKWPMIETMR